MERVKLKKLLKYSAFGKVFVGELLIQLIINIFFVILDIKFGRIADETRRKSFFIFE